MRIKRFILLAWPLFFLLNGCETPPEEPRASAAQKEGLRTVDRAQVAVADSNMILLDLRPKAEYEGLQHRETPKGHIPGARWLDLVRIIDEKGEPRDSASIAKALPKGAREGMTLVLYSHDGERAAVGGAALQKAGYANVAWYAGSWKDWTSVEDAPREFKSVADVARDSYKSYWKYLWAEISFNNFTFDYGYKPWWKNYFWLLVLVSAFFFIVELAKPWRPAQPRFRKDFWLDFFYMFFNFFLFGLIVFSAASNIAVLWFNDLLALFGIHNTVAIELASLPPLLRMAIFFVIADFLSWNVHRLLHRVPILWEFHKVHHSVEVMGFAAHLRYHWMENVVYSSLKYIPLSMIGFGIDDYFFIHMITLAIGHFNHANFNLNLGPLKYIFNNPQMHIWHHAYEMPEDKPYGVNFGISLSIWDYLWGTDWIPHSGRDIRLGFPGIKRFPQTFFGQLFYGMGRWGKRKGE